MLHDLVNDIVTPLDNGASAIVYLLKDGNVIKIGDITQGEIDRQKYFAAMGYALPVLQGEGRLFSLHKLPDEMVKSLLHTCPNVGDYVGYIVMPRATIPDGGHQVNHFIRMFATVWLDSGQVGRYGSMGWDAHWGNVIEYKGELMACDFS